VDFVVHLWKVSYLDNFVEAPDFDRRHPSGTMVGNCWDVFFGRGFEHHLLSLIFPQRTGLWRSQKTGKNQGKHVGEENFRPKNEKD